MILEKIKKPNDIHKIALADFPLLADEIRSMLIQSVSDTGGHLASNLGVVELTVALGLAFSPPQDTIVWDVGHQSYLFQGTVRENLRMGCPAADETQMWAVLERVKLADFLRGEKGLDTPLLERAANLSGGSANGWRCAGAAPRQSGVSFRRSHLQHRHGE